MTTRKKAKFEIMFTYHTCNFKKKNADPTEVFLEKKSMNEDSTFHEMNAEICTDPMNMIKQMDSHFVCKIRAENIDIDTIVS